MANPLAGYPRTSGDSSFFIQDLGTAAFYGLEFVDTSEDLLFTDQNLVSKPSVLIEGSKIVVDYGDSGSERDKEFVDILFKGMTSAGGTFSSGFTLTNAIYSDTVNDYSADLSASCTLNSYTNYVILGTFSTIGSTTETNYYESKYFETTPQITSAVGLTSGVTLNQLINYPTSTETSFVGNNISPGDYLDIDTSSNTGRYTVNGITVDTWSREIITLDNNLLITAEDLKGTEVIITHKRKVYNNASNPYNANKAYSHVISTTTNEGRLQFTIDGVAQKDLVLFRGNQYIFIENQGTVYPLTFSERPDGSHNGGTPYTDVGFYTITDNSLVRRITVIVPNNDTPNQLYYYNSLSSGMGGGIRVAGTYAYNSANLANISTSTTSTGNNLASFSSGGYGS